MLYLRACPRCKGAIAVERFAGLSIGSCLNCGHELTASEERRFGIVRPAKELPEDYARGVIPIQMELAAGGEHA